MFYSWDGVIRPKECNAIIDELKDLKFIEGGVVDDSKIRCASVHWVDKAHLLNRAVQSFVAEANEQYFNFNINVHEALQLARYEVGGKYGWHVDEPDFSKPIIRKLSTTVQLSNPDHYEGGVLEFFNGEKEPEVLPIQQQGSVIVFDSNTWHRVAPVTKGVRYSLSLWSKGPKYI